MKIETLIEQLQAIALIHPGIDVVKGGTNPDYNEDNHWELNPDIVSVDSTKSRQNRFDSLPAGAKYIGGYCPITGNKTTDGSTSVLTL